MSGLTIALDVSTTATGWAIFDGSTLLKSGVIRPKDKNFIARALKMSSELRMVQLRAIKDRGKHFSDIVIEKNNVGGVNQQSVIKIGIGTGIVLRNMIGEALYFVNVSSWRKHFQFRGKGKKILKQQAVDYVAEHFKKAVQDDEADAILIGQFFVDQALFKDGLESYEFSN